MQRILPVFTGFFLLANFPFLGFGSHAQIVTSCDASAQWRNHGAYVSCVAHTQTGGADVSVAAKSDIGKEDNDEDENEPDEVEVSPSPSPSPEVFPSPGASPTPEATVTVTSQASINSEIIGKIIERLENWLDRLQDLL